MPEIHVPYRDLRHMVEERALQNADQVYLYFYDDSITYKQFDEKVNRLGAAFLRLGVRRGDIVHLYMSNCPEYLITSLALNKVGAIAGPVNSWWQGEEVKYVLNDSQGIGIVVASEFVPTLQGIRKGCPHLNWVIEVGEPFDSAQGRKIDPEAYSFEELLEENEPNLIETPILPSDDAYLFYTSGTTGNPKGALITHEAVLYCCEGIRQALETKTIQENHVALIFLPLFHVNAMMSMVSVLYRGISATLRRGFSASEFGEVVQRYRPTFFSGVPAIYNILLEMKDELKKYDLGSLKYGVCGAAPLPLETFQRFEETFDIQIIEGYGLTEGTVASTLNPREGPKKIGSIGKAIPGQQVCIMDEKGNLLAPGQIGEIVVKGKNLMRGYLRKPKETAETLRDGWLHTGDMGTIDSDGYFFIVDRKKDVINRGGEKIYPKEVENVLFSHPMVQDVAIIGIPDKIFGQEAKAFLVLKPGQTSTAAEIQDFLKPKLAAYKVPKYVEFVDYLPKNIIGKTLKKELRQREGATGTS